MHLIYISRETADLPCRFPTVCVRQDEVRFLSLHRPETGQRGGRQGFRTVLSGT